MIDLHQADSVEVSVSSHAGELRIWVNVNGVCVLRAYGVKEFYYDGPEHSQELKEHCS